MNRASIESSPGIKRRYIRKPKPSFDSQKYRWISQFFWFMVTVWIGIQFYLFVSYHLNGQQGIAVSRPPGVEGFLPISSLISLRHLFLTGELSRVHPAGLVILAAIVLMSLLLRKSFCGYVCPVGLVSESLAFVGRKIFGKRLGMPAFLDYPLRSLKYLLLAFFIYAIFFINRVNELLLNVKYSKYPKERSQLL